jgi:hypothetical protein
MPRPLLALPLLLLAACVLPTDPGWERVVGEIAPEFSSSQTLAAPREAVAGMPFTVTVTTVGSSSCTRPAGASVRVTGLVAEITPMDEQATRAQLCTLDLSPFPRPVTLRFTTPGEAVVRVLGRGFAGQSSEVEVGVTVRP